MTVQTTYHVVIWVHRNNKVKENSSNTNVESTTLSDPQLLSKALIAKLSMSSFLKFGWSIRSFLDVRLMGL